MSRRRMDRTERLIRASGRIPRLWRCRCGKRSFATRRDALRFGRSQYPRESSRAYACNELPGQLVWHLTTQTAAKESKIRRTGSISREALEWLRSQRRGAA